MRFDGHIVAHRTSCGVCGGAELEQVLDLPSLPLTGMFSTTPGTPEGSSFDQQLLLCEDCGHLQLEAQVSPELLYSSEYSFRTSRSAPARRGAAAFAEFVWSIAGERIFNCVLDVGSNDSYLLELLSGRAANRVGVDPIWAGREAEVEAAGIRVIGAPIESVDAGDIGAPPDLVVCRHVMEHLFSPRDLLQKLRQIATDDAIFVFEVPDLDVLLERLRFDQVFHDHLQYFSLASLVRLLEETGMRYLSHTNSSVYPSAVMIAFSPAAEGGTPPVSSPPTKALVDDRIGLFTAEMTTVRAQMEQINGPIHGYGAAEDLPTLLYHLGCGPDALDVVFDDDPAKDGLFYRSLLVPIRCQDGGMDLTGAGFLVTAIDHAPAIARSLEAWSPNRVITPLVARVDDVRARNTGP